MAHGGKRPGSGRRASRVGVSAEARRARRRARILLEFVPGLESALRHWLPGELAEAICASLTEQLQAVVRDPEGFVA